MTGQEIFALRVKMGTPGKPLSREKFAVMVGVTAGSIINWENNGVIPYPLALKRLNELAKCVD